MKEELINEERLIKCLKDEKVIRCLKEMKTKKTADPNRMKPEFLKEFTESLPLLETLVRTLKRSV